MIDETLLGKFGKGYRMGLLAYWLIVDTSANILLYHHANS